MEKGVDRNRKHKNKMENAKKKGLKSPPPKKRGRDEEGEEEFQPTPGLTPAQQAIERLAHHSVSANERLTQEGLSNQKELTQEGQAKQQQALDSGLAKNNEVMGSFIAVMSPSTKNGSTTKTSPASSSTTKKRPASSLTTKKRPASSSTTMKMRQMEARMPSPKMPFPETRPPQRNVVSKQKMLHLLHSVERCLPLSPASSGALTWAPSTAPPVSFGASAWAPTWVPSADFPVSFGALMSAPSAAPPTSRFTEVRRDGLAIKICSTCC